MNYSKLLTVLSIIIVLIVGLGWLIFYFYTHQATQDILLDLSRKSFSIAKHQFIHLKNKIGGIKLSKKSKEDKSNSISKIDHEMSLNV